MNKLNKMIFLSFVSLLLFVLMPIAAYSQSNNDDFMDPKNPKGFYSPMVNPYMNPQFIHFLTNTMPNMITNQENQPPKDNLNSMIKDFQNNQQTFNDSRSSSGGTSSGSILNTNPYSPNNSHIPPMPCPFYQTNYGISGQTPALTTPQTNVSTPCTGPCD